MKETDLIRPDWPAPENVRVLSTTRRGGVSRGPWKSLNLGLGCGDDPEHVLANRSRLSDLLPSEPLWMHQVHGSRVLEAGEDERIQEADARVSSKRGQVLAVLTADCLPVLLCDVQGRAVGIAHAGWRGLAAGVIQATVAQMKIPPPRLLAWLGPSISGEAYEVGGDVRDVFAASPNLVRAGILDAFTPSGDRWRLDLPGAARLVLASLGVERVFGGGFCTLGEPNRFFSYRRDGVTGRMATLIWLA